MEGWEGQVLGPEHQGGDLPGKIRSLKSTLELLNARMCIMAVIQISRNHYFYFHKYFLTSMSW